MNNLITQVIMAKKDRNAILSYLKNLMMHIIKWKSQENKQSNSWKKSIDFSKKKIIDLQNNNPSLNDEFLKKNWDKTFDKATKKAENEMEPKSKITELTWKEIFINKYTLIGIFALIIYNIY